LLTILVCVHAGVDGALPDDGQGDSASRGAGRAGENAQANKVAIDVAMTMLRQIRPKLPANPKFLTK
jgi:hypothetical protein